MIIFLTSAVASLAIGSFIWAILRHHREQTLLARRFENLPKLEQAVENEDEDEKKREFEEIISIDESYEDTLTRNLYLSGKRTKKKIKMYKVLRFLGLSIPLFLMLFSAARGNLTQQTLLQILIVGVVVYFFTFFITNSMKKKRQNQLIKSMPEFFDLLVISLEAGISFSAAVPRVIKELPKNDPLAYEFEMMHNEFLAGVPFGQACDRLSKRCDVQDLSVIMNSLIESEQLGSSLSGVLRIQAHELRDKIRQRVREKAYKIPVKLLLPMGLIFTTLFVIVLGPVGYKMSKDTKSLSVKKEAQKEEIRERREEIAERNATRQGSRTL